MFHLGQPLQRNNTETPVRGYKMSANIDGIKTKNTRMSILQSSSWRPYMSLYERRGSLSR